MLLVVSTHNGRQSCAIIRDTREISELTGRGMIRIPPYRVNSQN